MWLMRWMPATECRKAALKAGSWCSPQHICALRGTATCKANSTENSELIKCRRCPVAYHMECIPKSILSTINKERGKRLWIARGRDAEGETSAKSQRHSRHSEML